MCVCVCVCVCVTVTVTVTVTVFVMLWEMKWFLILLIEGVTLETFQGVCTALQDPNKSCVANMNNVRCEASRHFRNKEKAYLKAKIDELEINSKIKCIRDSYRGISNFNKGFQHKTNVIKDEKGHLVRLLQYFG